MLGAVLVPVPFISVAAPVWTNAGYISQVEEYGDGIRVTGLELGPNPAGCSSISAALPVSDYTDAQRNRANSILLAAFVASKKVQIKLTDSSCNGNNPAYYAVRVLAQ